ncbi:MAG: hypothetical protein AVDCRST_MAG93-7255 [uncultured Chloroflexia bacterium]|uniref:Uncharacterized protein n=1 Tax=uncultured Chloroflexia bacterium TaxID=1672391 RepID=A0A6J4MFP8_9CHLR|nr:MAG: hypothetical protein AVDCRST_MAG93-7255 [uncultured Chloroflexia bacterium]
MDQRNIAVQTMIEHSTYSEASTPILVAEIGTAITKLVMVDLVDGTYRLITRAEAPSTLDAPDADAMLAVWQLITIIEGITGRAFTETSKPETPEAAYRQPYHLVVTTSAAEPLAVAIMALAPSSAREAVNAARGTYTNIVHTFSLDEAGISHEHWLSEQLTALSRAKPDVVLLAGGLEQGALLPVERLARLAGLLVRTMRPGPGMLYAGNSAATERVRAALGDVTVVANLRPTATSNRLEPARAALRTLHMAQRIPALPGYEALQPTVASSLTTVADSQGIMVRFLAERYARQIVFLDTGATHSTGQMQAHGHFTQVVLAGQGIGPGAAGLLEQSGAAALQRWLPFPARETNVANRLLNRTIHGNTVPVDEADLLLDHALLRESFLQTFRAMRAARTTMDYDLVIAAGAITRTPQPGLAALTLLDVLALDNYYGTLAIDLYLDSLGLFAASGALAHLAPDAAACLLEQDALNSGPLATLLVPQGQIVEGDAALDVELASTSADGVTDTQRATVHGGQIVRLPLPRGARGTLRIKPVADVHVGANAHGAEVATDPEAIIGSTLGVIIDARLRPLQLPEDDTARIACLRTWMEALDALPDLVEPDVRMSAPIEFPAQDTDTEMAAEESESTPQVIDDIAALAADTSESPHEPSDDAAALVADAPRDGDVSVVPSSSNTRRYSRVYDVVVVADPPEPDEDVADYEAVPTSALPALHEEERSAVTAFEDESLVTSEESADAAVVPATSTSQEMLEALIVEPIEPDTPIARSEEDGHAVSEADVSITSDVRFVDPVTSSSIVTEPEPLPDGVRTAPELAPNRGDETHTASNGDALSPSGSSEETLSPIPGEEETSSPIPSEEPPSVERDAYPRSLAVMKDDAPTDEAKETPRKKRRFLWW